MPIHGEIRIVRFLPGRVRLRVAALKGRPQLAQEIEAAFDGVPGLTGITTTNTTTGSVLIAYDPRRIVAEDGGQRLRAVLQQQLPDLDADAVIRALGGGPPTP